MRAVGLTQDLRELLGRLDRELSEIYGERYRGLVLFGSYARGEARGKDSDVDLLVLLEGEVNGWQEYLKIEPVSWPLSLESGYVLSIFPVNIEAYEEPRKPFIVNARKEGVSLV
jgi:uncharacterized protein